MDKENFEDKIGKLEKIVAELEKGDMSLDKSLEKFEEGMNLSKQCSQMLDKAEKKITILLEKEGEMKEEDFKIEE